MRSFNDGPARVSRYTGWRPSHIAARRRSAVREGHPPDRLPGLTPAAAPVSRARRGFLQGLADLGYVEGQNVAFVNRWAEGREDRLPGLAAELLRSKVDVITSASTEAIIASRNLSKTIPIVMITISDPIGNGLVASFARPGGNVTGVTLFSNELAGKRLEVLRQVAPKITRVAVLVQRDHPPTATFISETEAAAHTLGL